MGKSGGNKGRFLREIVMITSFAVLVVMVSVGLYADPASPAFGELAFKLSSLLPAAPTHH